jgi:urea transporter
LLCFPVLWAFFDEMTPLGLPWVTFPCVLVIFHCVLAAELRSDVEE